MRHRHIPQSAFTRVRPHAALDVAGITRDRLLRYAHLNAYFGGGFVNRIDEAIRRCRTFGVSTYQKLDEVAYAFIRKRLSIMVVGDRSYLMVTKGAPCHVLTVYSSAETVDGTAADFGMLTQQLQHHFRNLGPGRSAGLVRCHYHSCYRGDDRRAPYDSRRTGQEGLLSANEMLMC